MFHRQYRAWTSQTGIHAVQFKVRYRQALFNSIIYFFVEETKMARWTETFADQNHMVTISKHIPVGDIVRIVLNDGNVIEGVFRRMKIENNAGQGGWKYCGECEIETKDHSRFVLDYLDIKSASSLWSDPVATEYEHLGLITTGKAKPTSL